MKIRAIQNVSLVDYPDKVACTIFLYGCNFKCGFCHNPELVIAPDEREDVDERKFFEYLEKRKGLLEGVCITGGEPLLRIEKDFLKRIKELGYAVKIDTNGTCPEILESLISEGLVDYVAMDVKASEEKYKQTANALVDMDAIKKSIEIISDLENYEFRTTVVPELHDVEEVKRIAGLIRRFAGKKPKRYALQGFKNNGKFIDPYYNSIKNMNEETLNEMKKAVEDYFEEVIVRV